MGTPNRQGKLAIMSAFWLDNCVENDPNEGAKLPGGYWAVSGLADTGCEPARVDIFQPPLGAGDAPIPDKKSMTTMSADMWASQSFCPLAISIGSIKVTCSNRGAICQHTGSRRQRRSALPRDAR